MTTILKVLTILSAYLSLLPFLKPRDRSIKTLMWIPKLFAGALAPIHAIICGLGALVGLLRRDWKLATAGLIGTGLAVKFIEEVPESQAQFEAAFGSGWQAKIPEEIAPQMLPTRFSLPAKLTDQAQFQIEIDHPIVTVSGIVAEGCDDFSGGPISPPFPI